VGSLVRFLFLGMVLGFVASWFMYLQTRNMVWRQRAMNVLKWGVVIGLLGFGAVILRRAAVFV
jgi:hypothetical protein